MKKKIAAETVATFVLVFAGTGAMAVDGLSGGAVTGAGVAVVFGLAVAAMILAVGGVSGAHMNPAVTLGIWASGRMPGREVGPYIIGQCAGAVLASLALRLVFPGYATLGATLPKVAAPVSVAVEVLITASLVLAVLSVSARRPGNWLVIAAAVGAVVALGAYLAGPVTGGSMNPARSLGPALVSGRLGSLWIYLTAPVAGAFIAVPLCARVTTGCCCGAMQEGGCR